MTYLLVRGDEYCEVTEGFWRSTLALARSVGWQPTGGLGAVMMATFDKSDQRRVVTSAEARGFARALKKAIVASEANFGRGALAPWARVAQFISEGSFCIE